MRKLVPLVLLLLPAFAIAQKNAIKVNLSSLTIRNFHFSYERKIAPKITANLGIRIMPKGGLPMQGTFENLGGGLDDDNLKLSDLQIGNTAITPEIRFYLSKKAMKGFYVAPYARWSSFDLGLPFTYDVPNGTGGTSKENANFSGKITSFSGGVMFGTQFNLGKRLVLDIWWIGAHYGSSKGDLNFTSSTPLSSDEQTALRNTLNDFDPSPFKFTSTVSSSGAKIQSDGPWAGIRALGINLGVKF